MLVDMCRENYETDEHENCVMVFGEYVLSPAEKLREHFCKNNERLIIYQHEPILDKHLFDPNKILNHIKNADEVWDYDINNIKFLRQHGIDAKYKPPLFTKSLQKIKNLENPDIDVLFYGTLTEHRMKTLENIFTAGIVDESLSDIYYSLNLVWLNGIDDHRLDEFISRSKIILNLNRYDSKSPQQQTRIFYALNNEKCVLSEECEINYYGNLIEQFTTDPNKDWRMHLAQRISELLHNDNWKRYSNNRYEIINRDLYGYWNSKLNE